MTRTVLIIEDNELNMKLMNDILQAEKYKTFCARSAEEGMVLARRHLPDLILMDIRLPGMSGLEAVKEIRDDSVLSSTRIVAVTAYAMNGDEAEIRAAGCDGFIEKPFAIETLLGTVAAVIA